MIVRPLTALLKKDTFQWTEEAHFAFEQFKVAMIYTPVLSLPNFQELFQLFSYASGVCTGAILMQKGYPIVFFTKQGLLPLLKVCLNI